MNITLNDSTECTTLLVLVIIFLLSWYALRPKKIKEGDVPVRGHDLCWMLMDSHVPFIINAYQTMDAVTLEEVRTLVQERMVARQPRLMQKIVYCNGRPYWRKDEDFDVKHHVHAETNERIETEEQLQDYIGRVYTRNLDRSKPLWEMILIENYKDNQCAIISRFHHVVGDGISLVSMLFRAIDPLPPKSIPVAPAKVGQTASAWALLANIVNNINAVIGLLKTADRNPYHPQNPTGRVHVAWSSKIPLEDMKFVKNAFKCSINDLVMACIAGSMRSYLEKDSGLKNTTRARASIPVNIRSPHSDANLLQNYFGIVFFDIPVHESDRMGRLQLIKNRVASMKSSIEPHLVLLAMRLAAHLPAWMASPLLYFQSNKATLVLSNVPGVQEPVSFGGKQLYDMNFWPPGGPITLSISVMSYANQIACTVSADEAACSDVKHLAKAFTSEFEAFYALAKNTSDK